MRIRGVDLRKRPGEDVLRRLARLLVDDRAIGVDVVAPVVLLKRRGEDRVVLLETDRVPGADLVPQIALPVGLEELVREETLRLLPVLRPEHGSRRELGDRPPGTR